MKIDSYRFGEIIIAGKRYTRDVIVFPDRVTENWWRKEGHSLCAEDIKEVVDYRPEIFVIGTGYSGVMNVPEDLVKSLEKLGIKVEVMNTSEAVKSFNRYISQGKKVVGAFHLTC